MTEPAPASPWSWLHNRWLRIALIIFNVVMWPIALTALYMAFQGPNPKHPQNIPPSPSTSVSPELRTKPTSGVTDNPTNAPAITRTPTNRVPSHAVTPSPARTPKNPTPTTTPTPRPSATSPTPSASTATPSPSATSGGGIIPTLPTLPIGGGVGTPGNVEVHVSAGIQ